MQNIKDFDSSGETLYLLMFFATNGFLSVAVEMFEVGINPEFEILFFVFMFFIVIVLVR